MLAPRSGLPTSPINNVSPENTAYSSLLFSFSSTKHDDSIVWPGVWSSLIFQDSSWKSSLSIPSQNVKLTLEPGPIII